MTTDETDTFSLLKDLVHDRFNNMTAASNGLLKLMVDYDKDEAWRVYHSAFATEELRQENDCHTCRAFIRGVGGFITLDPETLEILNLWNHRGQKFPLEYRGPLEALDKYIQSLPIRGHFYHTEGTVGAAKTPDPKVGVVWEHFYAKIPREHRDTDGRLHRQSQKAAESVTVFRRAVEEATEEALDILVELIEGKSFYRSEEHEVTVKAFQGIVKAASQVPASLRESWFWAKASKNGPNLLHIRNSSIGTLISDLSEGKDVERSVKAFEKIVAPENYKRTSAIATPKMIATAKEKLQELGFMGALNRRQLDTRDLTAADALFVYRPTSRSGADVFDALAGEAPPSKKALNKLQEVTLENFLENFLPKAKKLRVLFENRHQPNLVALTGPQDPEENNLMSWDNSFAWSYTGGVADSIKERAKKAGAKVEGVWMRSTLAWHNKDDLDIHLVGPNGIHVYYGERENRSIKAHLDVDMNAGANSMAPDGLPVENIYIEDQLPEGRYEIRIHNFNKRQSDEGGFDVEIEVGDETRTFGDSSNPRGREFAPEIKFTVDAAGKVFWSDSALAKSASGMTKWGLKTGQFHTVTAITTSPNHWTKPVGNKHLFFLLQGAVADEKVWPFYNEFLNPKLRSERKVMEMLGSKIEVAEAQGAQLSGLGFSSTDSNSLIVEVEGQTKRTVKVLL